MVSRRIMLNLHQLGTSITGKLHYTFITLMARHARELSNVPGDIQDLGGH
jgi:hypothetical protein